MIDAEELRRLRELLRDIYVALLAAGWRDDELIARIKAEKDKL